jgi:hypothetical protein
MSKARDIASAAPAPSTVSATELGYVDGVTSAIQTQLDAKTAKSTLTTTGDIYYASAANTPARLAIGSTSDVLTVVAGVPGWAAPAGGGKVLQVVQNTYSTAKTISTTSYTATDLTATITPSSATSKILVMVNQSMYIERPAASAAGRLQLVRTTTSILNLNGANGWETVYFQAAGAASTEGSFRVNAQYLDSPATTSAITYSTEAARAFASGSVIVQPGSVQSVMILMEIGA